MIYDVLFEKKTKSRLQKKNKKKVWGFKQNKRTRGKRKEREKGGEIKGGGGVRSEEVRRVC